MMQKTVLAAALSVCASLSWAGALVDVSAAAAASAPNDLARAVVFTEVSGSSPKVLARQVNDRIAAAIADAKRYPTIKVQSGGVITQPHYSRAGRIENWQMRSELVLESKDTEGLSELIGKLQNTLSVAQVQYLPAADTRKAAEDRAVEQAIAAFKERASLVGKSLGKTYSIKQLTVHTGHYQPPVRMLKAVPMMAVAEDAAMPMEAGESEVRVQVSGQIELAN